MIPWQEGEERKRHRTGLSLWPHALGGGLWSPFLVYYFLVGIKILVLPLLSWKMLLPGDLWCFSWNLQNKRAHWIYCMIRFIYIHPKSANIKNELHKKIIFRDNSRPCSPTIIFLTRIFLSLLFSVAGLSGEPCVWSPHTWILHWIQGLSFYIPDLGQRSPHSGCRGEYSPPTSVLRSSSWLCSLLVAGSYLRWINGATSEPPEVAQDTVAGRDGTKASYWPGCLRKERAVACQPNAIASLGL